MTQSDYIMRMVEQLSQVLKQIIFRRENRQFDSADEILTEAYESLTGLNSQIIHQLSDDQLILLMGGESPTGHERLMVTAALLSEEATLAEHADNPDSDANLLRIKALSLFLQVLNQSEYWQSEEYVLKIKEIVDTVDLKVIPIHVLEKLVVYYKALSADKDMKSVQAELLSRNAS